MRVAVIGAGYVGLVTAACLADMGHRVRVGERDDKKLETLRQGQIQFFELGLEPIVAAGISSGSLTFHAENREAVQDAEVVLVAVPTPSLPNGSADLSFVETAVSDFAPHVRQGAVVALKSTVPVGSVARIQALVHSKRSDATVVSNPEFLREGNAVSDFYNPDRIVIGTPHEKAAAPLIELYASLNAPMLVTDPESSELVKYASNAYLATRITFANAVANLSEAVGANAADVLDGMAYDKRIGPDYLTPGPGYGGSCFPKDTKALIAIGEEAGYDFGLLRGVIEINEQQLDRIIAKAVSAVGGAQGTRVALWGLAFKAGTDDVRESPALNIGRRLAALGALVTAYDPAVYALPDDDTIDVVETALQAAKDADVLVIATEWAEFESVDLNDLRDAMTGTTVVDARNVLNPSLVGAAGLAYVGVGR